MNRRVVGPFNRVEGDLEVSLEVSDGRVTAAYVNSPLYRGFEQILRGKVPGDALVFAPRICGICSASQSSAAALALADLMQLRSAPNGRLARNLILATENLADHLTHFYLFFMPDFARESYRARGWHAEARARFRAAHGEAIRELLPARAGLLNVMGLMAGKWPHTLALQPGGTSRAIEASEKLRLRAMLVELRAFLERALFGDRLEAVAEIGSRAELERWRAGAARGDFGRFLAIADDLALHALGPGPGGFISYGAYPDEDGHQFARGIWDGGFRPLQLDAIAEDVSHAWMAGPAEALHPIEGRTQPVAEKADAYSWCKAPRLGGKPMETGALARQQVDGHPLVRELVASSGANVRNRMISRLLEIALVLPWMERWVAALEPREPFCAHAGMPEVGYGVGLVEAARGSLGHWIHVERGRIRNYQIIAPTTWNFSPRDASGIAGPLEQALAGAPVEPGEDTPVAVQHIVRSFDPCMVCTVH